MLAMDSYKLMELLSPTDLSLKVSSCRWTWQPISRESWTQHTGAGLNEPYLYNFGALPPSHTPLSPCRLQETSARSTTHPAAVGLKNGGVDRAWPLHIYLSCCTITAGSDMTHTVGSPTLGSFRGSTRCTMRRSLIRCLTNPCR